MESRWISFYQIKVCSLHRDGKLSVYVDAAWLSERKRGNSVSAAVSTTGADTKLSKILWYKHSD